MTDIKDSEETYNEFINKEPRQIYIESLRSNSSIEIPHSYENDIRKLCTDAVTAREFKIDNKEIIMPLLTESQNKIFDRPLPFSKIFINEKIKINEKTVLSGILLLQAKVNGKYYTITNNYSKDITIKLFYFYYYKEQYRVFSDCYNLTVNPKEFDNKSRNDIPIKEQNEILRKIKLFVCNFLDFLNQPEVITVDIYTDPRQNEKRAKRGKPPLAPVRTTVRVDGFLKKYPHLSRETERMPYSHRFWVRGHFRQLHSPKYKEKVGIRLWICPFIKGQGLLINKNYAITRKEKIPLNITTQTGDDANEKS